MAACLTAVACVLEQPVPARLRASVHVREIMQSAVYRVKYRAFRPFRQVAEAGDAARYFPVAAGCQFTAISADLAMAIPLKLP